MEEPKNKKRQREKAIWIIGITIGIILIITGLIKGEYIEVFQNAYYL